MDNIRIKLNLTDEDQSKIFFNENFRKLMEEKKILFVDNNYDVLLIHASKIDDEILKNEKNIIVIERIDSAIISNKHLLKLSNVIGMIKNNILRPKGLNNYFEFQSRYHSYLVLNSIKNKIEKNELINNNQNNIKEKPLLTRDDLEKVEVGFSFSFYPKLEKYNNLSVNFKSEREIDVHFAGTSNYGNCTSMTYHRKKCIEKILHLKNCKIDCFDHREHKSGEYLKTILNSKIIISPWGFGEVCYRDFEALYCGCILIKPDTSFVETYPDIFINNKTYIPCKVDFSDLQEKIDFIKENWDLFFRWRISNRKMLLRANTMDIFTNHFCKIIENFMKRSN